MDTLNQGKEDKNKDIIENNNKNNSGNRNTKSAQFKVAFITQAAVIAALYVVLVIMFNYCSRDLPSARRALPVVKIQRTSCLRTLSIL